VFGIRQIGEVQIEPKQQILEEQEENLSDMDARSIPDEGEIAEYAMHTIVYEFDHQSRKNVDFGKAHF
jgi:hypothetical protein